ncbi:hypothetical protein FRC01_009727 [Tulasnella sp. 417]|nr:hypothetical protein FRC01_009727 [Tulasnella sp. 417]
MATLPVISISPYVRKETSTVRDRLATSEALHKACRDFGFFYLDISSFANDAEMNTLMDLARQFFALPQERKDLISIRNQDSARGGKADNHEAIDLYAPVDNPDKTKPLWGTNQWPEDVQSFRSTYEAWIEKMKALGLIVMEAMAIGLGMTPQEWEELKGCVDHSFWVMRIIGYPPLPNDHDGFSCGAHKLSRWNVAADPTQDALQVFVPKSLAASNQMASSRTISLPKEEGDADGVWIYANPIPGCVVCNIGEMWEVWTRGMYKSTLHRVLHRGSNYRVSLPFFFEPNFDALVKPLAAVVRAQEASGEKIDDGTYAPVVYGEFLKSKVTNNFSEATPGKGKD